MFYKNAKLLSNVLGKITLGGGIDILDNPNHEQFRKI